MSRKVIEVSTLIRTLWVLVFALFVNDTWYNCKIYHCDWWMYHLVKVELEFLLNSINTEHLHLPTSYLHLSFYILIIFILALKLIFKLINGVFLLLIDFQVSFYVTVLTLIIHSQISYLCLYQPRSIMLTLNVVKLN